MQAGFTLLRLARMFFLSFPVHSPEFSSAVIHNSRPTSERTTIFVVLYDCKKLSVSPSLLYNRHQLFCVTSPKLFVSLKDLLWVAGKLIDVC